VRRTLLSTLAVAVLAGAASICPAQETKTLVTIAFSGYDELKADVAFVGKLADNPGLADGLEAMLTLMTKGQGLAGLDKSKPWGAVVQTDGEEFPIFGFIPVTDLEALLGVIEKFDLKSEKLPSGVYLLTAQDQEFFLKETDGWAYVAQTEEMLKDIPADPIAALGGLHEKYDLAVRVSVKSVPEPLRQMFIAQLNLGVQAGLQQMPGEDEDEYAIRKGITRRMTDQLVTMVNELDELLLGLAIDNKLGTSYLDIEVTALEGTSLAAQFNQMAEGKTKFAGFDLPGAAVTGNWTGTLSEADVTQAKGSIAGIRATALAALEEEELSDEELDLASQLLKDVFDVFEKTIDNKQVDGGIVVTLEPDAATAVAGGIVVDGAKLEKVLKQIAQLAQKDNPEVAKLIKLDAETHQGVRFHTLAIPAPEDEIAAKLFGKTIRVVVGVGDDSLYVAAGSDPVDVLKQVIDQSKSAAGKSIPPVRISVAATPVAQFIAAIAPKPETKQIAAKAAEILQQSGGKDHITITSKAIPNGSSTRLEIEQGVLKVLPQLAPVPGGGPGEAPPMGPPAGPPDEDDPF